MNLLEMKQSLSPTDFAKELRQRGPIFWSEPEQFWVVTDMKLAHQVLRDEGASADRSSLFAATSGCPFHKVSNFFGLVKKMMVNCDAPDHTARRRMAAAGISDLVLQDFAPKVLSIVDSLLASFGSRDFVQEIALPLPNIVLAELFSIPEARRSDFYRWANDMTQFFGGASTLENGIAADRAAAELTRYFGELIRERREIPQSDFISHLLKNQGELDDDEVIAQAAIMLVAGTITTTDQICNTLFDLLDSKAWQKTITAEAIERATQNDPAVSFIFRVAKGDLQIGDAQIQQGQPIFISVHAANRESKTSLSFGGGAHYCLGAKLGRIQMQILFTKLQAKFPRLLLADGSRRKVQSLGFAGTDFLALGF